MEDSKEFLDYIRLHILLNQATILLGRKFKDLYKTVSGEEWTNTPDCGQVFVNNFGQNCYKTIQQIQKSLLQTGDINQWDISIFESLFTSSPFNLEKEEKENVLSLVDIRNYVAHLGDKCISEEQFLNYFNQAKEAMIQLGGDAEEYEKIQTTTNIGGLELKTSQLTDEESMIKVRKLREDGNLAIQVNNFEKGITIYSEALILNGISDVERGLLISNRSHAYLMTLGNATCKNQIKETLSLALEDAKSVIRLRPTWWKGYYRLGRVYEYEEEWKSAIIAYNQALGLDPNQIEVKNCRDVCRYKDNKENIQEHLDPRNLPGSLAEDVNKIKEMYKNHSVADDPVSEMVNMNEKFMKSKDPKIVAMGCVFFGHRHVQGIDVPLNYDMAVQLYTKAAAAGNAEGIYNLGLLYQDGKGVNKDIHRAIQLFEQAAKLPATGILNMRNVGVAEAECAIGNCYRDGVGKQQEYSEAVKWYTRSCEHGSGEAASNLAFMYMGGMGVKNNEDTVAQLWTIAANRGVVLAMESLAWQYLKAGDVDEATMWFQRSIDGGNVHSMITQSNFDKVVERVKSDLKKMQNDFGLDESYDTFAKCLEAGKKELPEEIQSGFDMLESVLKDQKSLPSEPKAIDDSMAAKIWKCVPEIEVKAAEKFKYARIIKNSIMAYGIATPLLLDLMKNPKKATKDLRHKIVHEYAKCFSAAEFIASLTPDMREALRNICEQVFTTEQSQEDTDARICHIFLIMNSFEEALQFLKMSKLKYPDQVYFHSAYCHLLGWLERYDEGKKAALDSLAKFPTDVELLYIRSVMLRLSMSESDMENKSKVEIVKRAYLKFLQYAPVDHRKVPGAYYCLAYTALISDARGWRNKKMSKEVSKLYENGMNAESNLLACFLPYDSHQKLKLETFLSITKDFGGFSKTNMLSNESLVKEAPESTTVVSTKISELQLTNPNRIDIVVRHRGEQLMSHEIEQNVIVRTTQEPLHCQAAPAKLTSLKDISLAEMMVSNEDRVYDGFILNVTIFEDSIHGVFTSIHTIIADSNGDFQKCYIYNLDHEDKDKIEALSFGSTLSIMNPYFRLSTDGETGIRVDDPKSLIFHTNGTDCPKCRYCGVSKPDKNCGRCKKAKYCSRECQEGDWKKLKHKLICVPKTVNSNE